MHYKVQVNIETLQFILKDARFFNSLNEPPNRSDSVSEKLPPHRPVIVLCLLEKHKYAILIKASSTISNRPPNKSATIFHCSPNAQHLPLGESRLHISSFRLSFKDRLQNITKNRDIISRSRIYCTLDRRSTFF